MALNTYQSMNNWRSVTFFMHEAIICVSLK